MPKKLLMPFMVIAMIMMVLALSACNSEQAGIPTRTIDVGQPTARPTTAPMTTISPEARSTIHFETTGTIAGIRELLSIGEKGNTQFEIMSTPTKQGTMTAQQYAELATQISKADFFSLTDRYDSGTVADDRYYKITVQEGQKVKLVTVAETGGEGLTPQALLDLITMLNGIQDDMK